MDEITVHHHNDKVVYLTASRLRVDRSPADWKPAYDAYPERSIPGYQARYDAALEHVREVMDD